MDVDWTGAVGVTVAGAAAVTLLALLEHRYRGVPFRRAVWREIPVAALIGLMGYIIGSCYRG